MGIKIHGNMFKPEGKSYIHLWRIYGTKKSFKYSDGRLAPLPQSWEFVTEFKIKKSRGKIGWPTIELEPTDGDGYKFYNLIGVKGEGQEIWHEDNELTLPHDLPDEFEPPFDFGTWILWNLERVGAIAPGQIEGRLDDSQ